MVSQSQPLAGQVAVVTGASSGIGKEVALTLVVAGAKVGLGARRTELLDEVVKAIKDGGGEAIAVKTDVVVRQEVKNLVAETEKAFGPVDILINNAGIWAYTLMKNLKEDEWERMIDINCKGVMNGIGAVLDGMVKRCSGHIVNMSSENGRKGFPGMAVYSGTKYFVEGMSQAMRHELVSYGIRITNIQPGDVITPGALRKFEKEAEDLYDRTEKVECLQAQDVARSVLYALVQPKNVAVNEILIQPLEEPL